MNYIIKSGSTTITTGGTPALPGPVTLGGAQLDWSYTDGLWQQTIAIPVTAPDPLNGFDRMTVVLQAPDDATDQATVNADDSAGFIIDDDPAEASKIADITEPEFKAEIQWDADNPLIFIKHPEPANAEKWRVIVWSGSPHGRSTAPATLVVDAGPHPDGPDGEEFAPRVTGFSVAFAAETESGYRKDEATGRKALFLLSMWTKPDGGDPRPWLGGYVEMKRSDAADPGYWYKLTGLETDEDQLHIINELPAVQATFTFRLRSVGEGGTNTYVLGVTPEFELSIDPPAVVIPLQNVTGRGVTFQYYGADYYGKDELHIIPDFDPAANDPSYACIDFWGQRPDDIWRIYGRPASGGAKSAARIEHLPDADGDWNFAFVAQDVDSRDANGDIDTVAPDWPAGTPTYTVNIPAPTSATVFVQHIQAAAQAANLSMTYKGAALPAVPSALYPAGTPFMLTSVSPPKFYRVNAAGNGWDASVDAADVVNAHLIIAGGVIAHVIGTDELATTELLVGPPPGLTWDIDGNATSTGAQDKPTKFTVRDNNVSQTLLAFIGYESTVPFKGAYFRNVKIAPGIASTDKYFQCDGTTLGMVGGTFSLDLGGVVTEIKNQGVSGFGGVVGLYINETATGKKSVLSSGDLALMIGTTTYVRAYADAFVGGFLQVGSVSIVGGTGAVTATSFNVGVNQVLGPQQGAIADPSGGGVVDAQARTAIVFLLTAARNHGLIAT
jgi:hypothetical protein